MGDQPQIVPYQQIACLRSLWATRPQRRKRFAFLGRRQRPRKGTALEMQRQIQYVSGCRLQK